MASVHFQLLSNLYTLKSINASTFVPGFLSLLPVVHRNQSCNYSVVEAHCYALQCRRIDCEQISSRINQQLIAGRFSQEGLRQLCTKLFSMQLVKAFVAKASCNPLLIDSATYLLTINLPTCDYWTGKAGSYMVYAIGVHGLLYSNIVMKLAIEVSDVQSGLRNQKNHTHVHCPYTRSLHMWCICTMTYAHAKHTHSYRF